MNIGIDACTFRKTPTGIYNYLWNLVESFGRLQHDHLISLLLYGPRQADEKPLITTLRSVFPHAKIQYVWDGWPLVLLESNGLPGGRLGRQIDKFIFRLWRKIHIDFPNVAQNSSVRMRGPWRLRDYDVFHHTYGLMFPLNRGANVLTIYDLIPRKFPEQYPGASGWFGESFDSARHMDVVLTISENTKRDVMEFLKIPEDRIHVSPLAAHEQYHPIEDSNVIEATLARYGIAGRPYILSMGTLEYRRNLHRLVEAIHLLKQERQITEHKLVLIGTEGESSAIIFDTIQRLGLTEEVTWLGHIPFQDLPVLMNGADLFVYPSLYEGFGLPPLEAMACGTPVAASSTSSLPEVIGDGGLLFDPSDVEDMAGVIGRVIKDDRLKRELKARALARAGEFSWKRTAELTLRAYEEAFARAADDRVWKRMSRSKTVIQRAFFREFIDRLEDKYQLH